MSILNSNLNMGRASVTSPNWTRHANKPNSSAMSPSRKIISGNPTAEAANSASSFSSSLTADEASSILSQLASATHRSDVSRCRESAARVRYLVNQSDRNRRRLVAAGAASVLASAFRSFSTVLGASLNILSLILSTLVLVYSIDDEDVFCEISSPESLDAIVSIIKSDDSSGKLSAVLVLKQIVSSDGDSARAAARIDGLIETLLNLIRDPIDPLGKIAAQLTAFQLAATSEEWMLARFVRMGLISLVLESLEDPESEKRVSEAALSALDRLCGCEQGREKAYGNALTVPVLVKKLLGFSDLATDLAVSSLWKLCKNWEERGNEEGREGGCVVEALQDGISIKLLMLLQVECREGVKERATELLRILRDYDKGLGSIDTIDSRVNYRIFHSLVCPRSAFPAKTCVKQLRAQAHDFRQGGTQLRRRLWWQSMKMKLITLAIIIVLILIIVLSVCHGFSCK